VAVVIVGHDTTRYRNVKNLTLLTSVATVAVGLALAPTYARHRGGGWHAGDIHRSFILVQVFVQSRFILAPAFIQGPFIPTLGLIQGRFIQVLAFIRDHFNNA
jgi:hypothetical protein